jgi:uncharacterized LabA/DUF88 family protein
MPQGESVFTPLSGHHLRSWMLFVDGENLTMRAQALTKDGKFVLDQGNLYLPDTYVWMPRYGPDFVSRLSLADLQERVLRAYYYTSVVGDDEKLNEVRQALWQLGFHPEVFKKAKSSHKAKGVDIALTKDLLSHAFRNNFEVAVLIAGDGDYVPLVEEVKRLGKLVYIVFFAEGGTNSSLRLAADMFYDIGTIFKAAWGSMHS